MCLFHKMRKKGRKFILTDKLLLELKWIKIMDETLILRTLTINCHISMNIMSHFF